MCETSWARAARDAGGGACPDRSRGEGRSAAQRNHPPLSLRYTRFHARFSIPLEIYAATRSGFNSDTATKVLHTSDLELCAARAGSIAAVRQPAFPGHQAAVRKMPNWHVKRCRISRPESDSRSQIMPSAGVIRASGTRTHGKIIGRPPWRQRRPDLWFAADARADIRRVR